MKITKVLFSLVFALMTFSAMAQQQQPQQVQSDRVQLLPGAKELRGGIFNGQRIDKIIGNVSFKQRETYLYADSVYQYQGTELLEAFGNVRIVQGDTVTITGNRGTYDGTKRTAKMSGNVVMRDPRMTLTTPSLDYDMTTRTAVYTEGGVIVDPENRLESRRGSYDTNSKLYTFQKNVKVFTKDYNITAENMRYNTESKVVYFQGPTFIKGKQGDLYAEEGTYNTITKVSDFGRNAYILTPEYRLGGDDLHYDEARGYGYAKKNVTLRSLKDDVTIRGQVGHYWRDKGVSKVYGNPVMETVLDKDTLYMSADTLMSRESKAAGMPSLLYAYKGVKIFKSDLQGVCDSLTYNRTDSVMHMNVKPVLWSDQSQMVSDTIHMEIRNKNIHKLYMYSNAFIASEDTLQNYNQVKGRSMTAYFNKGDLRKVDVNGNGESLYFALEGDTLLTGVNQTVCSDMVLKFADNKLDNISFLLQPDASFIPPHELKAEQKQLQGFNWQSDLRPDKQQVFRKQAAIATTAVPAEPAKPKKKETTAMASGGKAAAPKNDSKAAAQPAKQQVAEPQTQTKVATPAKANTTSAGTLLNKKRDLKKN
ncbi:OstA-like protein [Pontibacter harenae]|uniref:OstA-like protein n=1 Tax=Pontibacter harenae TaxID=2894083 RepID=UPI001E5533A5|nr:OstA-like protein [Pontibacter harenae]MCC9168897.1 LPS export ABC transporter periplasmic protein LptC [Pontibacter harenae]